MHRCSQKKETAAIFHAEKYSLSFNAKNVKVIVQAGVVTLRGVVDSQDEKSRIATKTQALAGVNRVEDLLEVKSG